MSRQGSESFMLVSCGLKSKQHQMPGITFSFLKTQQGTNRVSSSSERKHRSGVSDDLWPLVLRVWLLARQATQSCAYGLRNAQGCSKLIKQCSEWGVKACCLHWRAFSGPAALCVLMDLQSPSPGQALLSPEQYVWTIMCVWILAMVTSLL